MMHKEAQILLATLIQLMAEKMEGWFNGQIEIIVARSQSQVL